MPTGGGVVGGRRCCQAALRESAWAAGLARCKDTFPFWTQGWVVCSSGAGAEWPSMGSKCLWSNVLTAPQ